MESEKNLRLVVVQDEDGWYYIKNLILYEKAFTPFPSIQDIEIYMGEELTLLSEAQIPEGNQSHKLT